MVTNPKNRAELQLAITQLKRQQDLDLELLEEQVQEVYTSLKPINLVKSTLKQASSPENILDILKSTSIGLTASYFSRRLFGTQGNHPLKSLLGTVLMFGATNLIAKNPGTAISAVGKIIEFIKSKFSTDKRDQPGT